MKFIPALIKQCLQPARQAGTEGLQSETSDSIQLTASARGNFSNKEASDFNVGQLAVSPANDTHGVSASADYRRKSCNPLTQDIHRQEMDSKENIEASGLPGSSFLDVEADSVAGSVTENINRPAQQQKMDSEKQLTSDTVPSITLTNTEPHGQSGRIYDREEHRAIGQADAISSVEKTLQNTVHKQKPATKEFYDSKVLSQDIDSTHRSIQPQDDAGLTQADTISSVEKMLHNTVHKQKPATKELHDSKAPGQDADSTHRSIRPRDDAGLAHAESSTEQSELTGARAVSREDNKEPPIVGTTENIPPASLIVQELSHVRQPLQATNPGSKSNEIPQVRIGHINVLIDDQVAAKPRRSSSTKTASSSIPFGLRGL